MKPFFLAVIALLLSETVHAAAIPLPRSRPAAASEAGSPADRFLNDPDLLRIPDPDPPGVASDCQIRMTDKIIAVFQSVPAITRASRGCAISSMTIVLSTSAYTASSAFFACQ